jgi:hypothetical protein
MNQIAGMIAMILGTKLFPEIAEKIMNELTASELGYVLDVLGIRDCFTYGDKYLNPIRDVDPSMSMFNQLTKDGFSVIMISPHLNALMVRIKESKRYWDTLESMHKSPHVLRFANKLAVWIVCIHKDASARIERVMRTTSSVSNNPLGWAMLDDDMNSAMRSPYDMRLHVFDNEAVIQPKRFLTTAFDWPNINPHPTTGSYVLNDPNAIIRMDTRMIPSLDVRMHQPTFTFVRRPDAIQVGDMRMNMDWSKPMFRNEPTQTVDIDYIDVIKEPLQVRRLKPKEYVKDDVGTPIGMFEAAPESVLRLTYTIDPDLEKISENPTMSSVTSTTEEMLRDMSIRIGSITDVTMDTRLNPFASLLRADSNYTFMYIDVPLSWA